MKFEYDREVDACYIELSKQKIYKTVSVSEYCNVDLDGKGHIIGIEILFASKNLQDFTPWLDTNSAASYLNVAPSTMRRWIKAHKVPFYQINHHYMFKKSELDEFIHSHRIKAA
ncbi:MAG: DUF2283 domain-containing protein [bacterium]